MEKIEVILTDKIRKILGKKIDVNRGIPKQKSTAWVNPEVFIYASSFEDNGGITGENVHISRIPLNISRSMKGFHEERPGKIFVEINCLAINYALVQKICLMIVAKIWLILESISEIPVSDLADKYNRLIFREFQSHLHSFSISSHEQDDIVNYCGKLVFYLEGFLHVSIAANGGLKKT